MTSCRDIANAEMAHCSSISNLIQKLCEQSFASCSKKLHHCHAHHPQFGIKLQQEKAIKYFKKTVYEILLKFIDTSVALSNVSLPGFTEVDCILAYIYNLRMSRHFDDANRLETMLNRLKGKDGIISDDIRACLLFLVCLTESGEPRQNYSKNKIKMEFPRAVLEKDELNILPLEPLMYGDTRTCRKNFYYMHYPREIFEVDMTISCSDYLNDNMTIFESCPGFDRNGNHLFSIPSLHSGLREKQPFMGALYNPEVIPMKNGLELRLDLPDIKDRNFNRPLGFKSSIQPMTIKNKKHNLLSEDEGFIETETPISCGSGLVKYEDIWETALKIESRNYFTWETIGCYAAKKEKPYLTEAGPTATEMLHRAHLYELYLMDPSFSVAPTVTVTHKSLIRDVFYLLTGVPSKTFLFMKEQTMFTVKSGIHLPGLTPACTANLLERFVDAGTEYCRLEKFASEICLNVCFGKGLVMQAFKGGLQQYLHYYQAMVLYLSQFQFSLLQLDHTFGKLRRQLSFIAQLCKCSSTSNINSHSSLPQGLELLTYLYQHALETWGQDHGIAMVFLLKSACVPYLRYLKQWMFEGICNDPYNEFHVEINDMFVNTQDESYWSKGFIWKTSDVKNAIPLFLTDIAKHIFVCGKSLNLLRLCCPQHHMCHTQEVAPSLILSTSEKTSETNKESSERYKAKMMQIFEQKQQLKDEIAKEKEEEKQRHLAKVHQNIKQISEKLKRNQEESRKIGEEKKRQCMEDLKLQIQDNEARKVKERELLEEEERLDAEKNAKEAEELKLAREEITTKYEMLTTNVVTEMQRAKWHSDRWKLQSERIECMEQLLREEQQENETIEAAKKTSIEANVTDVTDKAEISLQSTITSKENEKQLTSSEITTEVYVSSTDTSDIRDLYSEPTTSNQQDQIQEIRQIKSCQAALSEDKSNTLCESSGVTYFPEEKLVEPLTNSASVSTLKETDSNKSLNEFKNNESEQIAKEFLNEVEEGGQEKSKNILCKKNITETEDDACTNTREIELVTPTDDIDVWKTAIRDNSTNTVLKYRGRNLHGHASDSVIEKLIYHPAIQNNEKVTPTSTEKKGITDQTSTEDVNTVIIKQNTYSYRKDFDMFDKAPISDIITNIPNGKKYTQESNNNDVKSTHYIPLPVLLNRSLLPLLQTQIHLVNKSIVDYFMIDLGINDHFTALRNYYFFQDGEFGQMLSQLLFDKVVQCSSPAELLNPPTLNSILARALASTIHGDSPFADNLSFAVKYIPTVFPHNAASILNCLELRYKVSWPLNIVITDKCFDHYNCLLGLLLQVKRTFWLLNDMWYHLKTVERYHSAHNSLQCRQLQLCRHEMQHFARVMQSYMASQVLQVTWDDFQNALRQKVYSLDDLRNVHISYLKRACFRCLLTKKAAPVMKIIQDIFNVITKFHSQLLVASWQENPQTNQMEHPSFPLLMTSYKVFKEYSSFLYRVLRKLISKGYQPYLQEFLVLLDANCYYQRTVGISDADDIL